MSAQSPRRAHGPRATAPGIPQPVSSSPAPPAEELVAPTAKLLVTATEAATYLSVSRAHVYRLLQAGELRGVHSLSAMRIPVSELTGYVERLLRAATDSAVDPR